MTNQLGIMGLLEVRSRVVVQGSTTASMMDTLLFQFGAEETVVGLFIGIVLIVCAMRGLAHRSFYGAITVILATTTTYAYFHAKQEFIAALLGPQSELATSAFAVQTWLQAVRFFGLATVGGLLALILFQANRSTT